MTYRSDGNIKILKQEKSFSEETRAKTEELLNFWNSFLNQLEQKLLSVGYDEEVKKMLINENERQLLRTVNELKEYKQALQKKQKERKV